MALKYFFTGLSALKCLVILMVVLGVVGCANVSRDMKVTDSNTKSHYYAISKDLERQWKLNLSYLAMEGGQSPSLKLNTTYSESDDTGSSGDPRVISRENFSLKHVYFVSPIYGDSTLLGADYDLNVTAAELEHTFSRSYPFSIGLSFGLLFMDANVNFYELGQNNTQVLSYSKLHPKAGVDFRYAFHPMVSVSTFAGRSYDLEEVTTLQYGVALLVYPVESLEISARAYTFKSQFDGAKSSLDIVHNGTTLGVKLNF